MVIKLEKPTNVFELVDMRVIDGAGCDIGWMLEHKIAGFTFAFIHVRRRLNKKECEELKKQLTGADIIYWVGDEL